MLVTLQDEPFNLAYVPFNYIPAKRTKRLLDSCCVTKNAAAVLAYTLRLRLRLKRAKQGLLATFDLPLQTLNFLLLCLVAGSKSRNVLN